ncbi:TetR/AcrR family transcriptional regulator [Glaciihabitans sp. dw_435]|uniref:TetR/AcrR family transcriptional regulator n=1 Tax=Glaciihabitans sp. dw_435 TaxID=2720081 RepID=UPI001BD336CE|nr:TetR/AcrR family transcriptional regulator [Glaciihabitans sp. dw_435]
MPSTPSKRSTKPPSPQSTSPAVTAINLAGRDRFTTADVAAIAGCSIGTLYRYYKDRIAILDAIWPDRDAHLPTGFRLTKPTN